MEILAGFSFSCRSIGRSRKLRAWIVSTETLHRLASIFIVVQVAPHDFLMQPFKPAVPRKYTSMKTKKWSPLHCPHEKSTWLC
jgi:hypothetical protein